MSERPEGPSQQPEPDQGPDTSSSGPTPPHHQDTSNTYPEAPATSIGPGGAGNDPGLDGTSTPLGPGGTAPGGSRSPNPWIGIPIILAAGLLAVILLVSFFL